MTQYNTLNGKLSNSKFNKVKSAIETEIEVTLNLSSSFIEVLMRKLILHIDNY